MDHRKWPVARDAFPFFIPLALLAGLFYRFFRYLWILPGLTALFVLYFFRNPKRDGQAGEKELLSPADGKVTAITDVPEEKEFLHCPARKITIFLSLFDVHYNRSPIGGEVAYLRYQKGKFVPAYKRDAPDVNERNYLGLAAGPDGQKLLLVQIVGVAARRIVCWSKPGDRLTRGERFGLMKFGSCVEMYVPQDTVIFVKPGDKVKGGLSMLGRLP